MCRFHHCALPRSGANSFPALIPSSVFTAASNNPVCRTNEVSSHSNHAQIFRYLSHSTCSHPLCCLPLHKGYGVVITWQREKLLLWHSADVPSGLQPSSSTCSHSSERSSSFIWAVRICSSLPRQWWDN